MKMNTSKEQMLVNRKLMELARSKGEVFGGSIAVTFRRKHFASAYKRHLIKNNEVEHFDKYYDDESYDTETHAYRTEQIRDIDVFFKNPEDVASFKKDIYKIPGVYKIQGCNDAFNARIYKRHVLFDRNYNLEKIIVKYIMNHSFCEPGSGVKMSFMIDIVTPSVHCERKDNPVFMMQELTIKQLMWDSKSLTSTLYTTPSNELEKCYEIIDDFISDVCYIKEENPYMRVCMESYIQSHDELSVVEKLSKCLETRILVIKRILRYNIQHTIVNSPISFEKNCLTDCGICFSKKKYMFKWKTEQNNTQPYCLECINKYLHSLTVIDETVYHNYLDNREDDYFHRNPILTSEEWKYLNTNQIYLIENILVCPVGNKADFSCANPNYLGCK